VSAVSPAAAALLAAALALPGALPAAAADEVDAASAEPTADEAQKTAWQDELREKLDALAEARRRRDAALLAYKQVRHRDRVRGEPKQEAERELEAAGSALADAEERLDEFHARARRAGVPPGWLREVRRERERQIDPTAGAGEPAGSDGGTRSLDAYDETGHTYPLESYGPAAPDAR
jgi:hypothetical protein